ncbi:MAG: RNA polymerase sigma factor [Candidatus Binatia bacterium]
MATDEDLVGQVAAGDEAALHELLRRYERPLSHFIYRHTGGRDVEDLYQETWLRAVRAAGRFDPGRRFSTWVFQIAVNLCRDWHRRWASDVVPATDVTETAVDLGRVEARMDAVRLLAVLPEPQREVLILRYFHDLSEEESARILGCPKGTVKSRLHNALARLAAHVRMEEKP